MQLGSSRHISSQNISSHAVATGTVQPEPLQSGMQGYWYRWCHINSKQQQQ